MTVAKTPFRVCRERIQWAKSGLQTAHAEGKPTEGWKATLAKEMLSAQLGWLSAKELEWYLKYLAATVPAPQEPPVEAANEEVATTVAKKGRKGRKAA